MRLRLELVQPLRSEQRFQERPLAVPDCQRVLALRSNRVQHVGKLPRLLLVDAFERVEGVFRRVKYAGSPYVRDFVTYKKKAAARKLYVF
jgi:hypothetical protein